MRNFIKKTLLVINIVSCVLVLVFGIFGILAEILNPPIFERLLTKLKFPLDYNSFLLIAYISCAVLIITYFIRTKFFKN